MSTVWIGCVVEGDGEVSALPVLIRRIAQRLSPDLSVDVPRPVRVKRSRVGGHFGDLERGIELAARQLGTPGAILVLLDADDDCPATLGPELLQRVQTLKTTLPIGVVLANHEYENWFLAAAESLRGKRGLPADLAAPADAEAIRDAKGWLRRRMPPNRKYTETADQPALTALFDLDVGRAGSPSFDKCYREIERLIQRLMPPPSQEAS